MLFRSDAYASVLQFYQLGDCVSHYSAAGTRIVGEPLTFDGTWGLDDSDCNPSLTDATAVWYDPSGHAYSSFVVENGKLMEWYEHEAISDHDASQPKQGGRWYITAMNEPLVNNRVDHTESEKTTIEGIPLELTHEVQADFVDP